MRSLGFIFSALLIMVYTVTLNGWALAKLWAWFIVPSLGAPLLSVPYAIGVSLVVSYLAHTAKHEDKEDKDYAEILVRAFAIGTVKPLLALGFGAIVTRFI